MDKETTDFQKLPFSRLFKDYINNSHNLRDFYNTLPSDAGEVGNRITSHQFAGNREQCIPLLKDFNSKFEVEEQTFQQIDKLADPQSLTIVTGQQLTLYGGPLYTVYKTLTAIIYADRWSKKYNRQVIPVFWLADEDHDFDEAAEISLYDSTDTHTISYPKPSNSGITPPVGNITLDGEFDEFRKTVENTLDSTDFFDQLWKELHNSYKKDNSFRQAFGNWMLHLFGDHGLILAGSFDPDIKEYSKELLKQSVQKRKTITSTLEDTTYQLISAGYHGQVQVQDSNLFYIDQKGNRVKIQFDDGLWHTPNQQWDDEELINDIDKSPEKFSPNVFLRPVLQNHLLPVIGYVAGPAEIAYYGQMKQFYNLFDENMPLILPRFSITLIESSIERILEKLPFSWLDYQQRIEDLEKRFVESNDEVDIEKLFGIWKSQIEVLTRAKKDMIDEIDPSLTGSVGKAKATYFNELDKLKGKVYRSVKEQESTQLNRIQKIKNNLFPNGKLQEREIAFIYMMNKYGLDIWQNILENLRDDEPFDHKRIYL